MHRLLTCFLLAVSIIYSAGPSSAGRYGQAGPVVGPYGYTNVNPMWAPNKCTGAATDDCSHVIVVNPVTGSNTTCAAQLPIAFSVHPTNAQTCATLTKAASLLRRGYPDWVLVDCGVVFPPSSVSAVGFGNVPSRGTDAKRPVVLWDWGQCGHPLVNIGNQDPGAGLVSSSGVSGVYVQTPADGDNMIVMGFDVYASQRDPDNNPSNFNAVTAAAGGTNPGGLAANYNNSGVNILIEDIHASYGAGNNMGAAIGRKTNLVVRKCVFDHAYSYTAPANGIFYDLNPGLIVDDCLSWHNGWNETLYQPQSAPYTNSVVTGLPAVFSWPANLFFVNGTLVAPFTTQDGLVTPTNYTVQNVSGQGAGQTFNISRGDGVHASSLFHSAASFTASVAATLMNVSAVASGNLTTNQTLVTGAGLTTYPFIANTGSNTFNGTLSGGALTVNSMTTGTLGVGQLLATTGGVNAGTYIIGGTFPNFLVNGTQSLGPVNMSAPTVGNSTSFLGCAAGNFIASGAPSTGSSIVLGQTMSGGGIAPAVIYSGSGNLWTFAGSPQNSSGLIAMTTSGGAAFNGCLTNLKQVVYDPASLTGTLTVGNVLIGSGITGSPTISALGASGSFTVNTSGENIGTVTMNGATPGVGNWVVSTSQGTISSESMTSDSLFYSTGLTGNISLQGINFGFSEFGHCFYIHDDVPQQGGPDGPQQFLNNIIADCTNDQFRNGGKVVNNSWFRNGAAMAITQPLGSSLYNYNSNVVVDAMTSFYQTLTPNPGVQGLVGIGFQTSDDPVNSGITGTISDGTGLNPGNILTLTVVGVGIVAPGFNVQGAGSSFGVIPYPYPIVTGAINNATDPGQYTLNQTLGPLTFGSNGLVMGFPGASNLAPVNHNDNIVVGWSPALSSAGAVAGAPFTLASGTTNASVQGNKFCNFGTQGIIDNSANIITGAASGGNYTSVGGVAVAARLSGQSQILAAVGQGPIAITGVNGATYINTGATVTGAVWASTAGGQTTFTVNANLTTTLLAGTTVMVSNVVSTGGTGVGFNGTWTILSVTGSTVVVTQTAASSPGSYSSGGALVGSVIGIYISNSQFDLINVSFNAGAPISSSPSSKLQTYPVQNNQVGNITPNLVSQYCAGQSGVLSAAVMTNATISNGSGGAGNILQIGGSVTAGAVAPNQKAYGTGVADETFIVSGAGSTWTVSGAPQLVASTTISTSNVSPGSYLNTTTLAPLCAVANQCVTNDFLSMRSKVNRYNYMVNNQGPLLESCAWSNWARTQMGKATIACGNPTNQIGPPWPQFYNFLLKRDLDPASNDNSIAGLRMVG